MEMAGTQTILNTPYSLFFRACYIVLNSFRVYRYFRRYLTVSPLVLGELIIRR